MSFQLASTGVGPASVSLSVSLCHFIHLSIYVTRNFRAVVFDRAFSLFESEDVSATARPAPHVGRKDFVGHAGEALAGVVAGQVRERRAGVVLAERLTGQANQALQRIRAPLCAQRL